MATVSHTKEYLEKVLKAVDDAGGDVSQAARSLGINHATFRSQYTEARRRLQNGNDCGDCDQLKGANAHISRLTKQLEAAEKEAREWDTIAAAIGLRNTAPVTPDWTIKPPPKSSGIKGWPFLMLSDIHFGENVNPHLVNGVNAYNTRIAKRRLKKTCEKYIQLMLYHFGERKDYPGTILLLAGDLISGEIHEELTATGQGSALEQMFAIQGQLKTFIGELAEAFGRVHVYSVPGNHGRITRKPQSKRYAATNLDYWAGMHLANDFAGEDRVTFNVSASPDLPFSVAGHPFHLTHGDEAKGGTGMTGAITPVLRLAHKKLVSAHSTGYQSNQTLCIGHFHQTQFLGGESGPVIMNGSMVGYSEYAARLLFPAEPPQQTWWILHPSKGIIMSNTVKAEDFAPRDRAGQPELWGEWSEEGA